MYALAIFLPLIGAILAGFFGAWLKDRGSQVVTCGCMLLSAALGLPLIAVVLWLMARMGEWWWLYAWLTWMAFNITMLAVYPTWIAPLFNKFSPLTDESMKERVEIGRAHV